MSLLISAIILTKNEEKSIARCVKSVGFCDEILVINDYSTDETVEVINKLANRKVRVISHSLNDNFSQARNFGLHKAQSEWVLFVDADEEVPGALAFEISNTVSNWTRRIENEYNGFYIRRFDYIWGKILTHGESGIKLLRLAKKNDGEWVGMVHEEWRIKGKVGLLKNPIVHYPHQTVQEFLKKINFYTNIRAEELYAKKIKVYWWSIVGHPIGKFIVNYFIKRGFLDGISGLVFTIIMSFHSFLVRGKLWLMWGKR